MAVSGICPGFPRKTPGKSRENSWKIFPNREMLQILGFRAPGKANLPGTLGRHSWDLVCTFRAGCFLKSTVPAFSSFSESCRTNTREKSNRHLVLSSLYSFNCMPLALPCWTCIAQSQDLPLAHGLAPSETMVWDHGLNPPLSTENPRNEGFSRSGAPILGFGLAHPAPKG